MSSGIARPVLFLTAREGEYVLKDEFQLGSSSRSTPQITGSPLDPNTPVKRLFFMRINIAQFSRWDYPYPREYIEELKKIHGVHHVEENRDVPSILENYRNSKRKSHNFSSSNTPYLKLHRPASRAGAPLINAKSFISSLTFHDNIVRSFQPSIHGKTFVFANHEKSFYWLDVSAASSHSALLKMEFPRASPVCHDINSFTKSPKGLDVIIGFDTGDVLWYDPINFKYLRFNKNGQLNSSSVTAIKWVAGKDSQFLVSFRNGWLVLYDKYRHEQPLHIVVPEKNLKSLYLSSPGTFNILISINHQDDRKLNPVACYAFSKSPINGFCFSPDYQYLALVSERGTLKLFDFVKEHVLDVFHSYFAGLTCVTWSPDGKFIAIGGKDDLVSIYSFPLRKLVARCQGHKSWVTDVIFDAWRCDDDNYRIASVGLDRKLLLWDFSVSAIHRPKSAVYYVNHHSNNSKPAISDFDDVGDLTMGSEIDNSNYVNGDITIHPTLSRSLIPVISPITIYDVDDSPLSSVFFDPDCMITCATNGRIRTWQRP